MSKPETGRSYPAAHRRHFLDSLKNEQSSYIRRCAVWIQTEYPDSADDMLPEMRKMYAATLAKERKKIAQEQDLLV